MSSWAGPSPSPRTRWVILALGFVTQGLVYTVWYSFPVFFVELVETFDWSRGPAAGAFSLFVLLQSLSGPLVGTLVERVGARWVVPAGAACIAAGLLAASRLSSLIEFYLAFGVVVALGVGLAGWISNVAIMSRWFPRSMGLASGLTSAGIGVGILVVVPAVQQAITAFGWRTAYALLAALIVIGIAPANLLLQRRQPTGFAAGPGEARDSAALVVDADWVARDWTLGAALRSWRFWALFGSLGCATFTTQLVVAHQVAHLVDSGYDRAVAAFVVGLMGGVSVPAKIAWGAASDRIGRELTYTLGLSCMGLAIALLVVAGWAPLPALPFAFGLAMGFGYATVGSVAPTLVRDLFLGRAFAAIFGAVGLANGLGAALGSWLAGLIFDLTGSYLAAFTLAGLGCLGAIVLGWVAGPRRVRRPPLLRQRGDAAVERSHPIAASPSREH